MGIIVSYQVISDENAITEIERNINIGIDIENILQQYCHSIKSFNSFVKTWDPLYFLLFKISGNEIFIKLREGKRNEETNEYIQILQTDEIKNIYNELQKISIEILSNALNDEFFKSEISQQEGYNMESIYDIECMIIEFQELKNAVNTAFCTHSKIVQILMP
ncbi:protein of unknown function [Chryseobacterium arachidis]|uniref:Uncharacterized protein n=1 Tax=Chryseobacterium arachidis TaxID=1416778 RepID=A0A1M4ZGP2_9FLAO|nr:DUF1877 family protein [Chryseobacterium arachidis]SHF17145.1 protein of unknown function [Chryseobacterium arachidis]